METDAYPSGSFARMADDPGGYWMGTVCRVGGALCGLLLLVFGVVGLLSGVPFSGISGDKVMFLRANGLLSLLSVAVGLLLIAAAVIGRNISAAVNSGVAVVMLLSGLVNLTLIRTDLNFLAFTMGNIIFSFLVGVVLLTCGLYGRLPAGNAVSH